MVIMKDKSELIKLMDKHDLNFGNREDEVLKIVKEHFPEVYKKAKKYVKEDSGGDTNAKPHLVDHIWEALDIKDEKKFLKTLDSNLYQKANTLMNENKKGEPKAEAWAAKNKWFGKDSKMTNEAFDIHKKLVDEQGYDPKSDEYFEKIDKRMRVKFPDKFNDKK